MKIDYSNIQFPDEFKSGQVGAKKTAAASSRSASASLGVSSPTGEDTVRLSGVHNEIQLLSAALEKVPEVRTTRVNALRQQARAGQYQPESGKIADALIADQIGNAKA